MKVIVGSSFLELVHGARALDERNFKMNSSLNCKLDIKLEKHYHLSQTYSNQAIYNRDIGEDEK